MAIDSIPVPVLFVGTAIVVATAIEGGYLLGRRVHTRSGAQKEPVALIISPLLGLAAFMLAFTFGIVTSRHATKTSLVLDDANAIRTAWHRADFLPESDRAQAKRLLSRYLDTRIRFAAAHSLDPERLRAALAETYGLQEQLWDMAVENTRHDMPPGLTLYLASVNELISVHAKRVALGIQARLPMEVWVALFLLIGMGMLVVGYQTAITDSRRTKIQLVLVLSFSVVITLIASLDRPDSGVMRVTQQPLADLQAEIQAKSQGEQ